MSRSLVVPLLLAAAGAVAAVPSSARADDPPATPAPCAIVNGPSGYQAALAPFLSVIAHTVTPGSTTPPPPPSGGEADAAARAALGSQLTMIWLSTLHQGWDVGLAPGPLTLADARAAILAQLATRVSPADASFLADRLTVDPEPFSAAQLTQTQAGVVAALTGAGLRYGVGAGLCTMSDGIRVEVHVWTPDASAIPALQTQVAGLLAPFGDAVRFVVEQGEGPSAVSRQFLPIGHVPTAQTPVTSPSPGPSPSPAPAPARPAAPSIARYVALPATAHCIRGSTVRVRVKAAQRSSVSSLAVKAGGHRSSVNGARLVRGVSVKLKARHTKVTVALKLRSGASATRAYSFTRCA